MLTMVLWVVALSARDTDNALDIVPFADHELLLGTPLQARDVRLSVSVDKKSHHENQQVAVEVAFEQALRVPQSAATQ